MGYDLGTNSTSSHQALHSVSCKRWIDTVAGIEQRAGGVRLKMVILVFDDFNDVKEKNLH